MSVPVSPKRAEKLIPVTVNLPREIVDQADQLAEDQGLSKGDLYRDCFLDGLAAQFEKYSKSKVYGKLKRREEAQGTDNE
jgi:hypothetical protein